MLYTQPRPSTLIQSMQQRSYGLLKLEISSRKSNVNDNCKELIHTDSYFQILTEE